MYSNNKAVALLVAMLKEKRIRDVVVSAGTSHDAIARSLEEDEFFHTYSIVDERSAVFFAIGMIQEMKKPVAICCTAGTAASNYLSGVTEAFYRHLPLIIITADKHPYFLNQNEDQMIDQVGIFSSVVKYQCTLPVMDAKYDWWYANRLLNEAFLELDHHGAGPIHINVPIEYGKFAIGNTFTSEKLPDVHIIERYDRNWDDKKKQEVFKGLIDKKILVICGQADHIQSKKKRLVSEISRKYQVVFAVDKLSNLHCEGAVEISRPWLRNKSTANNLLLPDIIISIDGNTVLDIVYKLKTEINAEHWMITESGRVIDPFRKLGKVFEMGTLEFLQEMNRWGHAVQNLYLEQWEKEYAKVKIPDFPYSNLYVTEKMMGSIPGNSILHLGNSTTIRLAQLFDLEESVEVYCNRGVNGIDGCMSAFIGHAHASKKLAYLIIGDLSFFYDMNALWNKYLGSNIRIILINNGGAALFHFNQGLQNYPSLNMNVAAEHSASAKGWAENQGVQYIAANNKPEFDEALKVLCDPGYGRPVLLEVFTRKEIDAELQHKFYNQITIVDTKRKQQRKMFSIAVSLLGQKRADQLKHRILGY